MTLTPAHWIAPDRERLGCEGYARAVIIRQLVTDGWIRTRRYIRPVTYWSITLHDLDAETRQRLQAWVDKGLAADWLKPASELRIYSVSDDKTSIMEAAELKAWR